MRFAGLAALLLAVAACGEGSGSSEPRTAPTEYVAHGTVLESPGHGPQLCFAVMDSLPPQCGGPDITNWSWKSAGGEESERGTTWGDYAVHVTYADGDLTLTRRPADPESVDLGAGAGDRDFASPCPEPAGGWFPEGRTMVGEADRSRAIALAEQDPAYGELWVDQRPVGEPTEENMNDPERLILNVRVTKDAAGVEKRLREVWGGALCVSVALHTDAELDRIQQEAGDRAGGLLLGSSRGDDRVDLDVLLDEGGRLQTSFDQEYGEGAVRVTSALQEADPA